MSEKDYYGQESGKMEEYLEDNTGLVPAGEQVFGNHQMARAADREKFGQSLNDSQNDCIYQRQYLFYPGSGWLLGLFDGRALVSRALTACQ